MKYYESNPFRNFEEESFVKDIKQQKRKEKANKEARISKYTKKGYKLAIDIVNTYCSFGCFKYEDPSSITILKFDEDNYEVRSNSGLLTEEETNKTFVDYDDLINYINQFYDYNIIEEHYKEEEKNMMDIISDNTIRTLRTDNVYIDNTGEMYFDTEM
jgi:hypothetical protein